jgi:hypothetical protein
MPDDDPHSAADRERAVHRERAAEIGSRLAIVGTVCFDREPDAVLLEDAPPSLAAGDPVPVG